MFSSNPLSSLFKALIRLRSSQRYQALLGARLPAWCTRGRLELLLYVVIALVAVSKALKPGHVVGDGVDMYGSIWFFWYARDALEHLANPSHTDLFFFPLGKDIFAHTGNNLVDAYLSAPFQWVFGFPGWSRWWIVFVMVGNALTFRVLARHLFDSPNAVLAATVAWELNPYVMFEITCGRYTQGFLFFLPIAIWAFLKMQEDTRWRWPVLVGIMTALQAWTYWFMAYFMAVAFCCLGVHSLVTARRRADGATVNQVRTRFVVRCGVAACAAFVLVAPAILSMKAAVGQDQVPGLSGGGPKDLFSLPNDLSNNVAQALHGYDLFGDMGPPMLTYWTWGVPLVLWILIGPGRWRWLPILGAIVLFSLGPSASMPFLEGRPVMPHYMAAYHYLPFFDRLWFPYRMLVIAMLVGALAFGFLVSRLEQRVRLLPFEIPLLVVLFAGATGLEQSRYGIFPFVAKDLSPPEVFEWIGDQEGEGAQAVIGLPFGPGQPNIVWQVLHERPLWGGMGENATLLWPDGFRRRTRNAFYKSLMKAIRQPDQPVDELRYPKNQREKLVKLEGFRWVVLDRRIMEQEFREEFKEDGKDAVREITAKILLGLNHVVGSSPVAAEGQWVVWDLWGEAVAPESLKPTQERMLRSTWDTVDAPLYEKELTRAGRAHRTVPPGTNPGEAAKAGGKRRIKMKKRKD